LRASGGRGTLRTGVRLILHPANGGKRSPRWTLT